MAVLDFKTYGFLCGIIHADGTDIISGKHHSSAVNIVLTVGCACRVLSQIYVIQFNVDFLSLHIDCTTSFRSCCIYCEIAEICVCLADDRRICDDFLTCGTADIYGFSYLKGLCKGDVTCNRNVRNSQHNRIS